MKDWLAKRLVRHADLKFEKLIKAATEGDQYIPNWQWYIQKKYIKVVYDLADRLT